MINRVIHWIQTGANASEGVQLINEACAPSVVIRLVAKNPERYVRFMINWLCYRYHIDRARLKLEKPATEQAPAKPIGFREEFPFLNLPTCPPELEALASRKFGRYHQYVELHRQLRDCTSLDECARVSRELLSNYLENRAIWDELNYYKEHGSCLGRHPIFAAFRRRKEVLAMNIRDLMVRLRQVKNNIWRVKNEMAKGDKPHLDAERRARLFTYEQELADINRLLEHE